MEYYLSSLYNADWTGVPTLPPKQHFLHGTKAVQVLDPVPTLNNVTPPPDLGKGKKTDPALKLGSWKPQC